MDGDKPDRAARQQQKRDNDSLVVEEEEEQRARLQQHQHELRAMQLLLARSESEEHGRLLAAGRSLLLPDHLRSFLTTGSDWQQQQQQRQAQEDDIWNRRREASAAYSQMRLAAAASSSSDVSAALYSAAIPPPASSRLHHLLLADFDVSRQRLNDLDHRTAADFASNLSVLSRLQDSRANRRESSNNNNTTTTSDPYEQALLRARLLGEPSLASSTYGYGSLLSGLGQSTGPLSRGLAYEAQLLREAQLALLSQQRDASGDVRSLDPGSSSSSREASLRGGGSSPDIARLFDRSTTIRAGHTTIDSLFEHRRRMLHTAAVVPQTTDDDPAFLAAQRDELRRSVLEQQDLNDRLEQLTRQRQQLDYHNNRSALLLDGDSYHAGRSSVPTAAALASSSGRAASTNEVVSRNDYEITIPWEALVGDGGLADAKVLRGVVSDLHIVLMAQMRPCQLHHEDRIGSYKTRDIGFRGMCCKVGVCDLFPPPPLCVFFTHFLLFAFCKTSALRWRYRIRPLLSRIIDQLGEREHLQVHHEASDGRMPHVSKGTTRKRLEARAARRAQPVPLPARIAPALLCQDLGQDSTGRTIGR
jgi:hypothetical protein